MKTLFSFIIIIFVFAGNTNAQQTSDKPYLKQEDLKRFSGEWQYKSNDTTFIINLSISKVFVKNGNGVYIDLVVGDYTLKKGTQILQSSTDCSTIYSGSYVDKKTSHNKIKFLFKDLKKGTKRGDVLFELIDNGKKALWILTNTEGVRIGEYDYSFSVPTKAVFNKVN